MISIGKLQAQVAAAAAVTDTIKLGDMIARAVAFVEKETRRYFGPISETTEYVYGNGTRVLRLKEQVVIVDEDYPEDSATVEERMYPGGTATAIGDFLVRHEEEDKVSHLVRTGGSVWTLGYEYAVTYERGYNVDAGPADIEQLILDLIEDRLELAGDEELQSETIGGVSYTRFKSSDISLIDGGEETISSWRRQVFA